MKYLFLDCESAGLRGEIFSAAMIGHAGEILFDGFFRHPDLKTNEWLRDNVAPNLTGHEYATALEFQTAFSVAYEKARETHGHGDYKSLAVVTNMGCPVESNFFQQLFSIGLLDEFSGPYPMLDTASLLSLIGQDPTSEQEYADAVGLELPAGYRPHSALSDAALTRAVWFFLKSHKIK